MEPMKYLEELVERYPVLDVVKDDVLSAYKLLEGCYAQGGKLLIAGNGGSCADAEHIVGELMKGFVKRRPVSAELAQALKAADPQMGEKLAENLQGGLPAIALIMVLRKSSARDAIMKSGISKKTVVQALIVGVIMGFYNSLFGPGIGTVAIIAFTMIMHYDSRVASGNGKVLIVLTNAVALFSYVKTGNVAYEIAVPAALSAILGNLVGVNLAIKKGDKIIKPVMLIIVILTVVKFAWENQLWG